MRQTAGHRCTELDEHLRDHGQPGQAVRDGQNRAGNVPANHAFSRQLAVGDREQDTLVRGKGLDGTPRRGLGLGLRLGTRARGHGNALDGQ